MPPLRAAVLGHRAAMAAPQERNLTDANATTRKPRAPPSTGSVRRFFANLGPGLITGAADDDPSGISTYSITGAAFGYMPLWTALFSFPLMAAVQLMCARLGLVTGRGLAGVLRRYYPRWVLWGACALLMVANVFNIGADLGGMAEATEMMTGINSLYWTPLYTLLMIALLFWCSYRVIARLFKWLTLVLFAYVAAAFLAHPDWQAVLRATCGATRRMVERVSRDLGGHPRHHDLSVSVLLASLARSRGRAGPWAAHRGPAARRDRRGVAHRAHRRAHGDGVFERRDVFHYLDDSRDAARARHHSHHHGTGSGGQRCAPSPAMARTCSSPLG